MTAGVAALADALAHVEAGGVPDRAASAVLLAARGDDLDRLCAVAARVRDDGLRAAGRTVVEDGVQRGVVTYSPKVFLPVTRLCRDRCHYCTFVTTPGHLERAGEPVYLGEEEVLAVAREGAALGCLEALFTLGDRPEDRWPAARAWLDAHGFASTLAYVRHLARRVLDETGLLPHLNPGVMSAAELADLRPVAPSMGMMLETTSRRLFETRGLAHFGSPDKDPALRLQVLEDAGRARVPFTTGVLVGIGETLVERADALHALAEVQARHGGLQEVIVQNFRAKPDTAMRHVDDLGLAEYRAALAVARLVLGPGLRLQAPPNLVDSAEGTRECHDLLDAGVDDWGGVSPLTPDHVNPERPWPSLERLRALSAEAGFVLRARLTAQEPYVLGALRGTGRPEDAWIDPALHDAVAAVADLDGAHGPAGLARPGVRPVARSLGAA